MTMTAAQKRAKDKYNKKASIKAKNASKQKENFKNVAATLPKAEAEYIAALFKAHGLKPSEVIRGAAAALADGQPIRTEREPLPIPPEYQTPTDTDTGKASEE